MNYTRSPAKMHRLILPLQALFFVALLLSYLGQHTKAYAQNGPVIIRDTEIEAILKQWSEPVILAAGLDPRAVNLILVQDPAVNAFVAGGQNIFLYTGLIQKADHAGEIIGVIAHELGHIRGGHLVRTRDAMQNVAYEAILGAILGIGAAAITGEGGLGAAISAGVSSTAQNRFLSYSRAQESSADQAALTYLEKAQISPQGLVSFMQKLENDELLPTSQQSEYVRTHPLTRNRVNALRAGTERSNMATRENPLAWKSQTARMQAKLAGFIQPERVQWDYDRADKSIYARYARAIALYRDNFVEEALAAMDDLIASEPQNPFFHELKGQMLVDFGRVAQALPSYSRAIALMGDNSAALIRTAYAHALIESADNDDRAYEAAITELKIALRDEPRSARIYRLLATAYGRKGDDALARLYLSEQNLRIGRTRDAKIQVQTALDGLPEGSPDWIRAKDILNAIEQAEKNN